MIDYHHFVQIDFSSLIDVRIFNNGRSEPGSDSINSLTEAAAGDVTVLPDKSTPIPTPTQGIIFLTDLT